MKMTTPSNEEQTPLRIHSNTDFDFAMRISFVRGAIHGFNRMLNYCSKPYNNVITYDQISKAKEAEVKILEDNLAEIKKSVDNLHMEVSDKKAFKEWLEAKKNKKR